MIIVRMGLSVAWQNDSQNRSFLTTLRFDRQLVAAQPQSQSIRINISTTTVDESQSTEIIGTRSNYKNNSL